jgi:hypothetical protein
MKLCEAVSFLESRNRQYRKVDRGEVSMQLKGFFVFALSFLLLCMPVAPVSASSAAGQMFTKGTAEINGVPAPAATSVFPGDRINTEKETTTSLSFPGGDAAVISEMSKAALGERDGRLAVRLEDGTVSVLNKGAKPIVIEARGALIQAASSQSAVYDVILRGNSLRVISRGGLVRVETANKTAELQPGNELNATVVPPDPPAIPTGLSSASTWILIGSAAAGVTGLALGAVAIHKANNCHLSPDKINIIC